MMTQSGHLCRGDVVVQNSTVVEGGFLKGLSLPQISEKNNQQEITANVLSYKFDNRSIHCNINSKSVLLNSNFLYCTIVR